ncbi:alpha/beta hydrolase [Bremerella cremea]|uniref:Alpha/beta hydrolase n=1 Tax=Bremerella cremea TaxID=1031537 RepID=A0A368KMC0_9BACT|nr:alpha/beta fold hydrolase [Bremerella cremea]RCS43258.1 alpha/beta hydrolase [Bremerella cremea]
MQENVILIHGIGSFSLLLRPYARYLRSKSFQARCWGYRSFGATVTDDAAQLREVLAPLAAAEQPTHFVTHSMGGIVLRAALAGMTWRNPGRLVMLAPPNHGAHSARLAAFLLRWPVPALVDISDTPDSLVQSLPEPTQFETGIISGQRDLLVARASTPLGCQRDHILVACGHNMLMFHPTGMRETLHFLQHGQFSPDAKRAAGMPTQSRSHRTNP